MTFIALLVTLAAQAQTSIEVQSTNCAWIHVTNLKSEFEYIVVASGRWSVCPKKSACPADVGGKRVNGHGFQRHRTNSEKYPLSKANTPGFWGALAGRVGSKNPFQLGTGTIIRGESGSLMMRINDADCSDNFGALRVSIRQQKKRTTSQFNAGARKKECLRIRDKCIAKATAPVKFTKLKQAKVSAGDCTWKEIGVLHENAEYRVEANGLWAVCPVRGKCPSDVAGKLTGPDGFQAHVTRSNIYPLNKTSPPGHWASLAGRLNRGPAFPIGSSKALKGKGTLYVQINDGDCSDNWGEIDVSLAKRPLISRSQGIAVAKTTINAKKCAWTNVAQLNAGFRYEVEAVGTWSVCPSSSNCPTDVAGKRTNADGFQAHETRSARYPLNKTQPKGYWGSLAGRVGAGATFQLGKHFLLEDQRGTLALRINDGECSDNWGSMTVSLRKWPDITKECRDDFATCVKECSSNSECPRGLACVQNMCVGDGALRFTLRWSSHSDLDLHVVTPSSAEISFENRLADGGTLDRDDRSGGPGSVENVFWRTEPPDGRYKVWVRNYRGGPAAFRLLGSKNANVVIDHSGSIGPSKSDSSALFISVP